MRTPFLATRPATQRDYVSAAIPLAIVVGLAAYAAPSGATIAGADTDFMSACFGAASFLQGITAYLLYGQWRAGRHAPIGFLAIAFGFSAIMQLGFWIEYPGTIAEHGLIPIVSGRIAWIWQSWHLGFFALVLAFALTSRRLRPSDHAVGWSALGAAALAAATFAIVIVWSGSLPALSQRGEWLPLNTRVMLPFALLAGAVTLATVAWVTRLKRWIDVYVALFVVALIAEAYLLLIGARRFTFGWYASRTEVMVVSTAIVVELIRQVNAMYRQLTLENRRLARAAMIDPLTGVANRRAFDVHLSDLKGSAVLLLIDIDHFKPYNDTAGHHAGDECLRRVARSLAASVLRGDDLLVRYGGDEFAAILRDTDLDDAIRVAERIRRAVADLEIERGEGAGGGVVTVSIGAAACTARETPGQTLRRADLALYRAKEGGRDRVCFDEEDAERPLTRRTPLP